MNIFSAGIEFTIEHCCNCGIPFAMTSDLVRRRRNDHKSFYCPCGHSQYYFGKSDKEKLKEKLSKCELTINYLEADKEHLTGSLEQTERRRRATVGVVTKMKKEREG